MDPDAGNFAFAPGSPALALGIQPLDARKAGLEPAHETRLLGKRITTTIRPNGGLLEAPTQLVIACDEPDAHVHYTLDGAEPTPRAPRYTRPITLSRAATVRARAFAAGGTDFAGATAQFHPPPQPIVQDFEKVAVGGQTPGAVTGEDPGKKQYTARVTGERAASGTRSLKFTDGPGQKYPFNPHVYYRCRFVDGTMVGRFAVRLDANAQLHYQWRHYEDGYHNGATVRIEPGGKLEHEGKLLLTLPLEAWLRFEVTCGVGDAAAGTFTTKVWLPGAREPKVFARLPHDPKFERLDWVGFVANGQRECVFYVDEVEVRPERG